MVRDRRGVTKETFEQSIGGASIESLLQQVPLQPGDAMFVPAGTAHTIGTGFVLCEIQQNSDLTYRVYDYNRRDANGRARELHLEKAFDVIRFGAQRGGKVVPATIQRDGLTKTFFTACRYFATDFRNLADGIRHRTLAIRRPGFREHLIPTLRTLDRS